MFMFTKAWNLVFKFVIISFGLEPILMKFCVQTAIMRCLLGGYCFQIISLKVAISSVNIGNQLKKECFLLSFLFFNGIMVSFSIFLQANNSNWEWKKNAISFDLFAGLSIIRKQKIKSVFDSLLIWFILLHTQWKSVYFLLFFRTWKFGGFSFCVGVNIFLLRWQFNYFRRMSIAWTCK